MALAPTMTAMRLDAPSHRLRQVSEPVPDPGPGQILVEIAACGVCRTDLHVIDGELAQGKPDVIPGHEIVGRIAALGAGVDGFATGQRVGVPWLGATCGSCFYCREDRENLCDAPQFTGYTLDGGYADYAVADHRYCFPIPDGYDDIHAAPLLCAGLIGHRALTLAGDGRRLGIYGFGAAAHIVAQVAVWQDRELYAFTRPGDEAAQRFAIALGAVWAGGSDVPAPEPLDAAIIFAPVGALVPAALAALRKGGVLVCGGIHMSDIPAFPYELLWGERVVRSVANLTRRDAREFLALAPQVPVHTQVEVYPLAEAQAAVDALRDGRLTGAAVLVP